MESLIPPFDAYKGDAPYIFVSYAHKNSDIVYAHLTRLRNEGFRIWYDEGIDPGADWSDEIATALVHAEVFLIFISEAAVASHNVRKEIVFAIDQRKHMVCVHIEEIELPSGLKMQLGNIQALLEGRFYDKEKFYDRLFNSLLPEATQGEERTDLPVRDIPRKAKTVAKGAEPSFWTKYKKILMGFLVVMIMGLAAMGGFALMQKVGDGITFADKNLESALREEMQKPRGAITKNDLIAFKGRLELVGRGIVDISPLRHMRGLSMLSLEHNNITDISPLEDLKELVILGLANNRISDLTPLTNLKKSLTGLSLDGNTVKDLTQLRPLANLEVLHLRDVPITDLELGRYLRRLRIVILNDTGHGLDPQALWSFKANLPPNCEVEIEPAGGKK